MEWLANADLKARRTVYAHLSTYAQLIGSWRWTEKDDAASLSVERLFKVAWEPDCVSCMLVDFAR